MIVDRSHYYWAVATAVISIVATILYLAYATLAPNGPSGGSWQGMLFGLLGSGCMIGAGLLAARKKVPKWNIGTAQSWLRGHIWLGLLSIPLIFFHAGFRFGGFLEQVLMATFIIVSLSGMFGLALQQFLPRMMSSISPAQAIAPQIHVACERLRQTAESRVEKICKDKFLLPLIRENRRIQFSPELAISSFYWDQLSTFLAPGASSKHPLANPTVATVRFARLKDTLPAELEPVVEDLRLACEERRELMAQARVHWWLHGWVIFHVPLSVTLLILGLLHIFMSTYY